MTEESLDAFAEREELRKVAEKAQRELKRAKLKVADQIEAVYRAAHDAAVVVGRAKAVAPKRDRREGGEEESLIHLTDLQYGKETDTYNMKKCAQRVAQFSEKIASLTEIQRADHPVTRGHIMLGGDMVEGVNIFPGQVYEIEAYLYEQLFGCARLIVDFVRAGLEVYEHVVVWEESGNHGRIGRRGEWPATDNIDRMAYRIARDQLSNEPRLTWHEQESWHRIVQIGAYRALLVHGDEIKSFGGNVPAYGILRKVNAWSSGVVEPFIDAYMGHFHSVMTLPMANGGRIFVTASTESGSVYAAEFMAALGKPSQRLHFIDPRKGRVTSEHIIWLD